MKNIITSYISREDILNTDKNQLLHILNNMFREIEQHDVIAKYIVCGDSEFFHLCAQLDCFCITQLWTAKVKHIDSMQGIRVTSEYFPFVWKKL